jgi:Putative DNA-binding domain
MLKLETKEDLNGLYTGDVKESLHLEYKASDAIDKRDDTKKIEMARDVSAFANADGGQIIYGMTEEDHHPKGLDQGLNPQTYPEIWFDQVLQQHISPKLTGHRVRHVPLSNNAVAVVIDIEATKGDPHQVSDNKYYRRHNFNRLAMEHYEIREMMHRTVDPALEIEFESTQGQAAYQTIEFDAHAEMSKEIPIRPIVLNKSNQLTIYAAIFAFIDSRVELTTMGGWQRAQGTGFPARCHTLLHKISVPGSFPIFREVPMALTPFHFTVHQHLLQTAPLKLALGYQIRAPGCFKENYGSIDIDQSGRMVIRMPPN